MVERILEVKVLWGDVVLDVRHFGEDDAVTVGEAPGASFHITGDLAGENLFTLAGPGGLRGHVVHTAQGPRPLGIGEVRRVKLGQLAFLLKYIAPARGLRTGPISGVDTALGKWLAIFFILAAGLWAALLMTPESEAAELGYGTNPARHYFQFMGDMERPEKRFDEIKKAREAVRPKDDDPGKWKRASRVAKAEGKRPSRTRPREDDRSVATRAGILELLRQRGGGGSGDGFVSGGSTPVSLDEHLEGLPRAGMGDSAGFGGLRNVGGSPGLGGSGLDIGGIADRARDGRRYSSVRIPEGVHTGAKVKKDRKRTHLIGDGLPKSLVGEYIERRWNQFKYCYSKELQKDPNLYGQVTATFTISGNGRVGDAQILRSTIGNTNVEACVLRVIRRIRFPTPRGGGEVIVTYPFLFTTAGSTPSR